MDQDSDIISHLQFVKVSVTHDGGPSNIESSGYLTTASGAMLLAELRRNGYIISFPVRGTCPEPSPPAATDSPRHVESRRGGPRPLIDNMINSPKSGETPADPKPL